MSGTNVWMKLKSSRKYKPVPLFYSFEQKIFYIPQFLCLQHTVEEIEEKIRLFRDNIFFESLKKHQQKILQKLEIRNDEIEEPLFVPRQTSLESISKDYNFLFLGLHGGTGENGAFQSVLDKLKLPYNGPGEKCSRLCMDKFKTGQVIEAAHIPGVTVAKKILMEMDENPADIWKKLKQSGFSKSVILKPRGDGCSAGVIRVNSLDEFNKAITYFRSGNPCIPEKAIHAFHGRIELPSRKMDEILIEDFIVTDRVDLKNLNIRWKTRSNFIEITVGYLGEGGKLTVMYPSQTVAALETLSLEEKFMGGTGINLVPPPTSFVKPAIIKKVQQNLKKVGNALGIEGYSRIDCFMNRKNGDLIVIEANTLPALTPSTTFFQQAAKLPVPLNPQKLLEKIIDIGKRRFGKISKK
jgi:D-alanine-D-alanine ligase-like ATP-grasp enzyme